VLFRRRDPPAIGERLRIFFVPRRSYGRSFKYYGKRVLRLSGSPHAVAAGVAAGAAASCTPFIGFHFILSFVIAVLVRGNMFAAAIGTAVGNPLTFPVIWVTTYQIGSRIEGLWREGPRPHLPPHFAEAVLNRGWDAIAPLLTPMVIGAVPLALTVGLVFYVLTRSALGLYQRGRREMLAKRRDGEKSDISAEQAE
jgi:uncharacterized protein (DUF2062 family)